MDRDDARVRDAETVEGFLQVRSIGLEPDSYRFGPHAGPDLHPARTLPAEGD